jgi:hypothetical protein
MQETSGLAASLVVETILPEIQVHSLELLLGVTFTMRETATGLLAIAAFLTTGCGDLLSLHALYGTQSQVFDPAIEGRWENDDHVIQVRRADDAYAVELQSKKTPKDEPSKMEMHLTDIGGVRFADLLPADQIGHMILRVRLNDGQLRIDFLDSPWLRQRIPHDDADIENHRKQAMLLQNTERLRGLVAKFAREPQAFADETTYHRAK